MLKVVKYNTELEETSDLDLLDINIKCIYNKTNKTAKQSIKLQNHSGSQISYL